MGLLEGKKALILGVANNKSIAYGIAKNFHQEGAELGFNYLNEKIEKRVRPIAEEFGSDLVVKCDVSSDDDIDNLVKAVKEKWGSVDIIVHSIAYANKEYLEGYYYRVDRQSFLQAMDISVYSFTAIAREFLPIMNEGGSLLTLSYYGAEKVVYNYNVMGVAKAALEASVKYLARDLGELKKIRVNAISAGPIKTLAASGIDQFSHILKTAEERAPLKKSVTIDEVGKAALFLCSDLGTGVTGEILYVDAGYHIIGM
ncbi:MAG TPA: enoyl-ACP reductase [Persephonella sp.]|uniref:Enoyl-[acyl-carrier-protein] reductase [NADH] n=1 Tax=Persephonella marina (strain DSM 14350 / EX-H1) TaxID=123214 RepID=C0QSJ0_PERMH|nr:MULTISPECIES: enoyl-ACP reductase [Persephonella]ACO03612.1 enoyl-[acyl-carrier-protein] reductase [NADH] (nadh-dependent enoyl-acp reductase) [Persephonella marina EX-H1]HCB69382.1 enoyl-ACP reductase [Persephonella sp.]